MAFSLSEWLGGAWEFIKDIFAPKPREMPYHGIGSQARVFGKTVLERRRRAALAKHYNRRMVQVNPRQNPLQRRPVQMQGRTSMPLPRMYPRRTMRTARPQMFNRQRPMALPIGPQRMFPRGRQLRRRPI